MASPAIYTVRYRLHTTAQNAPWTEFGEPTTDLNDVLTGLQANRTYDLDILAVDESGATTSQIVTFTTATRAPSAPGNPTPGTVTSGSIVLNWSPSASGSGSIFYQVMYRQSGSGNNYVPYGPPQSGTSETVTGLAAFTNYDFYINASNNAGNSNSPSVTIQTLPVGTPPSPVTNITATNIQISTLVLNWTNSASGSTPITYQPKYRINGASTWTPFGSPVSQGPVTVVNLLGGQTYDLTVDAINSVTTTTTTFITRQLAQTATAPSAPGQPQFTNITASSATVTWAPSATGLPTPTYQVQYRTGANAFANYGAPITGTTLNMTGLLPATPYIVQVVASNTGGSATSQTNQLNTASGTAIPPSAPTNVQPTNTTQSGFTLTWTLSATGDAPIFYQAQYRPHAGGAWVNIGAQVQTNSATVTGLSPPGSVWDVQVVASNAASSGVPSQLSTVTLVAAGKQESPEGTTVTGAAQSFVDPQGITWTLVQAADGMQAAQNGVPDTNTHNLQALLLHNGIVYYETAGGQWAQWNPVTKGWVLIAGDPRVVVPPPPTPGGPSPEYAKATAVAGGTSAVLIDNDGDSWRIDANGQIDWLPAGTTTWQVQTSTQNVTVIEKVGGEIAQSAPYASAPNGVGWWMSNTTSPGVVTWTQISGDPSAPAPPASGRFLLANGRVTDPNGLVFHAQGINCIYRRPWGSGGGSMDLGRFSSGALKRAFPLINLVRFADLYATSLANASHPATDATVRNWVNDLTSNKIIVYAEVHYTGNYATGQALTDACNWLAEWATTFQSNPYVWFGTQNEPHGDAAGISNMMRAMYDAVRNTGNTNPVLCSMGDNPPGMTASNFSTMTNAGWDYHYYGWQPANGISLQSLLNQLLIFNNQQGAIAPFCFEFGDSTDGATRDANWMDVMNQVGALPNGFAAWYANWDTSTADLLLAAPFDFSVLTDYGTVIRGMMK